MCGKFHWCGTCAQLLGGLSKAGSHEFDSCLLLCDPLCVADLGPICKEDDCLSFAVYEGCCTRHSVIWEVFLHDPNFVGSQGKVAQGATKTHQECWDAVNTTLTDAVIGHIQKAGAAATEKPYVYMGDILHMLVMLPC